MVLKVLRNTTHMVPLFCVREIGCQQLGYHGSNWSRSITALAGYRPRNATQVPCEATSHARTLRACVLVREIHGRKVMSDVRYSFKVGMLDMKDHKILSMSPTHECLRCPRTPKAELLTRVLHCRGAPSAERPVAVDLTDILTGNRRWH